MMKNGPTPPTMNRLSQIALGFVTLIAGVLEVYAWTRPYTQRLIEAAENGYTATVAYLLQQRVFRILVPKWAANTALWKAACNGHSACVKTLIPFSSPKIDHSQALLTAASHGHHECVELLLPASDPNTMDDLALVFAAKHGHPECVQALLPYCAQIDDSRALEALQSAAVSGHTECVKLLIPFSDPKANDSDALLQAFVQGHSECVDLLLPVSCPYTVLGALKQKYSDEPTLWQNFEQHITQAHKAGLHAELATHPTAHVRRPSRKM